MLYSPRCDFNDLLIKRGDVHTGDVRLSVPCSAAYPSREFIVRHHRRFRR